MKFDVYLKNKGILKIGIFLFKACIDLGELVDCCWGSVKCGMLVFGFEGRRVLFNFHFDNYIRRS